MNTNFNVIGLTGLGIKPKSTAPEALTTHNLDLSRYKIVLLNLYYKKISKFTGVIVSNFFTKFIKLKMRIDNQFLKT